MRLFKVIVRFSDGSPDNIVQLHSFDEAQERFEYLVKFELDGLLSNIWCVSLLKGKKTLRHYNNFLNVSL